MLLRLTIKGIRSLTPITWVDFQGQTLQWEKGLSHWFLKQLEKVSPRLKDRHVEHVRDDDIAQRDLGQKRGPEGRVRQQVPEQLENALEGERVEEDGRQQADVEGVVGVVCVEHDDVAPQLPGEVEPHVEDERREDPEGRDEDGHVDVLLVLLQDGHRDEGDGEGQGARKLEKNLNLF